MSYSGPPTLKESKWKNFSQKMMNPPSERTTKRPVRENGPRRKILDLPYLSTITKTFFAPNTKESNPYIYLESAKSSKPFRNFWKVEAPHNAAATTKKWWSSSKLSPNWRNTTRPYTERILTKNSTNHSGRSGKNHILLCSNSTQKLNNSKNSAYRPNRLSLLCARNASRLPKSRRLKLRFQGPNFFIGPTSTKWAREILISTTGSPW